MLGFSSKHNCAYMSQDFPSQSHTILIFLSSLLPSSLPPSLPSSLLPFLPFFLPLSGSGLRLKKVAVWLCGSQRKIWKNRSVGLKAAKRSMKTLIIPHCYTCLLKHSGAEQEVSGVVLFFLFQVPIPGFADVQTLCWLCHFHLPLHLFDSDVCHKEVSMTVFSSCYLLSIYHKVVSRARRNNTRMIFCTDR